MVKSCNNIMYRPYGDYVEASAGINAKSATLRNKETKQNWKVIFLGEDFIGFGGKTMSYKEAFEMFEYQDGTPFGAECCNILKGSRMWWEDPLGETSGTVIVDEDCNNFPIEDLDSIVKVRRLEDPEGLALFEVLAKELYIKKPSA